MTGPTPSPRTKGSAATILIVEDDPHAAEISRLYLAREGHEVAVASTGTDGLRMAQDLKPSLIVLDLMLPGLDGYEICKRLRDTGDTVPIIMLTARVDEADKLSGLDYGADDYMTKPFSPRELVARTRAVLRRTMPPEEPEDAQNSDLLTYGDLVVNLSARSVNNGDAEVKLTPTEFNLLAHFMRSPGHVHPRERIIERVFGYDFDGFDRTLDTHVSNLRKKIERDSGGVKYLTTVYGIGYRFGDA